MKTVGVMTLCLLGLIAAACADGQNGVSEPALGATAPQTFQIDVSQQSIGTEISGDSDRGGFLIRYLGPDQGAYRFQFVRDNSTGAAVRLIFWTDRRGQIVRVDYDESDLEITYEPHDCSTSAGDCTFRETLSGIGTRTIHSNATLNGEMFAYTQSILTPGGRVLLKRGKGRLHRLGYFVEHSYSRFSKSGERKHWARIRQ